MIEDQNEKFKCSVVIEIARKTYEISSTKKGNIVIAWLSEVPNFSIANLPIKDVALTTYQNRTYLDTGNMLFGPLDSKAQAILNALIQDEPAKVNLH